EPQIPKRTWVVALATLDQTKAWLVGGGDVESPPPHAARSNGTRAFDMRSRAFISPSRFETRFPGIPTPIRCAVAAAVSMLGDDIPTMQCCLYLKDPSMPRIIPAGASTFRSRE